MSAANQLRELRARQRGQEIPSSDVDERTSEADNLSSSGTGASQAEKLLEIVGSACEVWRDGAAQPYVTAPIDDAVANIRLRSSEFRAWLARAYRAAHGGVPCREAMTGALNVLEGDALFGATEHATHLRVARFDGRIYLDLGNASWHAVEVDSTGWRIVPARAVPVRFRRGGGMQALPTPVRGGDLAELRDLASLGDDDAFILATGWLLAALRPSGPYPVLHLVAEQGSGKTTLAKMLRRLIDPHAAELRGSIREPRDLAVAADNAHVVAIDNLSNLSAWLSDALCCLSTGGGFATRSLFTDREEAIFEAVRPLILTGISDVATRGDLLDRAVTVSLPRLSCQRPEADLWAAYEAARPRLLGAVLDATAAALAQERAAPPPAGLRMVDAARWVASAELGGAVPWQSGEHERAVRRSRAAGHEVAIDASSIGPQLVELIDTAGASGWVGTAAELLADLNARLEEGRRRPQGWPSRPRDLSAEVKRLAPALRAVGMGVEHEREPGGKRRRLIRLHCGGRPR